MRWTDTSGTETSHGRCGEGNSVNLEEAMVYAEEPDLEIQKSILTGRSSKETCGRNFG
jgi:hypothetical protein